MTTIYYDGKKTVYSDKRIVINGYLNFNGSKIKRFLNKKNEWVNIWAAGDCDKVNQFYEWIIETICYKNYSQIVDFSDLQAIVLIEKLNKPFHIYAQIGHTSAIDIINQPFAIGTGADFVLGRLHGKQNLTTEEVLEAFKVAHFYDCNTSKEVDIYSPFGE